MPLGGRRHCRVTSSQLLQWLRPKGNFWRRLEETSIEFMPLDILEKDGNRILSGFVVVNVASPVRRQIGLSILVPWNLEFTTPHTSL